LRELSISKLPVRAALQLTALLIKRLKDAEAPRRVKNAIAVGELTRRRPRPDSVKSAPGICTRVEHIHIKTLREIALIIGISTVSGSTSARKF
jgi:hypothetical protein